MTNKTLFLGVVAQITEFCRAEGFVEHPCYVPAWVPENQAYEASLIRLYTAGYIDQFNLSFHPAWHAFRFDVTRSENSFDIRTLDDIPRDAGQWTDCWLYQPFDKYLLLAGRAWNPFSIRPGFGLGTRQPREAGSGAQNVFQNFSRNSKYLFAALKGQYRGRLVEIRHCEIKRKPSHH